MLSYDYKYTHSNATYRSTLVWGVSSCLNVAVRYELREEITSLVQSKRIPMHTMAMKWRFSNIEYLITQDSQGANEPF